MGCQLKLSDLHVIANNADHMIMSSRQTQLSLAGKRLNGAIVDETEAQLLIMICKFFMFLFSDRAIPLNQYFTTRKIICVREVNDHFKCRYEK